MHRWLRGTAVAAVPVAPLLVLLYPTARIPPAPPIALVNHAGGAAVGSALFATGDEAGLDARPPAASAPPLPIGIAGGLPDDAQAMLRLADGSVATLKVGERAGGWRLVGIERDRLHLQRGGEERTLVLPVQVTDAPRRSDVRPQVDIGEEQAAGPAQ